VFQRTRRDLKNYLLGDGSAVELDLDDVGLLLSAPEQLLLGVADDADHLLKVKNPFNLLSFKLIYLTLVIM
jgi:hypothetical protein